MSSMPYYEYNDEKRESETDSIETDSLDHIAAIYEKIKSIQLEISQIKTLLEEQNRAYLCSIM